MSWLNIDVGALSHLWVLDLIGLLLLLKLLILLVLELLICNTDSKLRLLWVAYSMANHWLLRNIVKSMVLILELLLLWQLMMHDSASLDGQHPVANRSSALA